MLEDTYNTIKAAELGHEDLSMVKELTSRCLNDEALRFYKDIFNIETESASDDVTDIRDEQDDCENHKTDEVTESSEEDGYTYRPKRKTMSDIKRTLISDSMYKMIDDAITSTPKITKAVKILHENGVNVSYSTVARRKNDLIAKSVYASCSNYAIKSEIAFNEMKEAGCREYNGNIYAADGTPIPAILTTNFVKCNLWNGVRIPTKYIVALYHGRKVNKNTAIWHLNEDQCDTRIDNLGINTDDPTLSREKNIRSDVDIENICRIFAEEKGDPLKIWRRCVDDLGDFITSSLLSRLRTKEVFDVISDKYFTVSDVKRWYKEEDYLEALNITPKDKYIDDNTKYTEMVEKYAFTNKEIPLQDKEFILKNFLEQEYDMSELSFTDDLKYAIESIHNKLEDKGINMSTSYIRGIININGGGLELGG